MNMNGPMIFMILAIVVGVIMIVTGHPLSMKTDRFTPENLKKYARASGVAFIILGLGGLGFSYTIHQAANEKMSWYLVLACLLIMIGAVVAQVVTLRKYRNKK